MLDRVGRCSCRNLLASVMDSRDKKELPLEDTPVRALLVRMGVKVPEELGELAEEEPPNWAGWEEIGGVDNGEELLKEEAEGLINI